MTRPRVILDQVVINTSEEETSFDTRTRTTTSTATLTPNVSLYDLDVITAQASIITIANPIGTAVEGNGFVIRIKATGAYAITFDTDYSGAYGQGLPTLTLANKTLYIIVVRNSVDGTYDVLNYIEEV